MASETHIEDCSEAGRLDVRLNLDAVRNLLIDMDGVLYRGSEPLPGAADLIGWLRSRAHHFQLVTNNATMTPTQYVDKLASMGIRIDAGEVMTSSLATGLYLRREGAAGATAFVLGEDGIREAVREAGLELANESVDWVVVGLDRRLTYDSLATAALAIQAGARFVGTNPDTSFPAEHGLVPGAGAILAALQVTTGVQPTVVGKPHPLMLELAIERLGGNAGNTAMLGDRLDTDIAGARAAGIPSILVLTGVSTRQDIVRLGVEPSMVVEDLRDLMIRWDAGHGLDGRSGAAR